VVYNAESGVASFTLNDGGEDQLPTTQVRWRPETSLSRTTNVLVSVGADGRIVQWHVPSGKCLSEISEDNQLFCVDYAADGSWFATAGKRREVRVYDESTKQVREVLTGGDPEVASGHAGRIFSLKLHPELRHVLVTGGWDSTLQVWDTRLGHAVRAIPGPHVCGDAVDISGDGHTILTGSWRAEEQLQLWDFRTSRLLSSPPWRPQADSGELAQPCMVYAAQFSKGPESESVAAGGSGSCEAQLFDRDNGKVCGCVTGLTAACYSVDFSHGGSMLAVGGGGGCVRVVDIYAA